jgi:hypothetical protein
MLEWDAFGEIELSLRVLQLMEAVDSRSCLKREPVNG